MSARWRLPAKTLVLIAAAVAYLMSCVPARGQTREEEFETYVAKATEAQSAGDVQGAIAAYKNALAIRPTVGELWSNLGLMQHQAGDTADALASFASAHRLQPKLFVPVLFLGLENLEMNRPKEAIPYLQQAGRLNPNDPNVPVYLGRAYFASKEFEAAATAYWHGAELNPKSGDVWYRLGLSHFEAAESDSRSLATRHRASPYFHALEADSLSSQEKLDRAEKIYREVLESQPHPPCVRSSLGFVLLRQDKGPEADALFQEDLKAGGCSIARLGLLRSAFEKEGEAVSLAPLATLWRVDAGFVETYLPLLSSGLTQEQFTRLDQVFDRTRFVDMTPEEVARMKGALHGGSSGSTSDPVRRVSSAAPQSARAAYFRGDYRACAYTLLRSTDTLSREQLSVLGACSFFTGDFDGALAAAEKMRHISGAEDESLYWSIRARQGLGVRALVRAGETEPDSIRMHELLAETYRDMGRYESAENEYAAALSMDPGRFSALLGSAANYLQEFRLEPASEMIQRALAVKPSDPEANYIAGEILIDQHQFDAAEPHLKIALSAKAELVPRVHALLGRVYASKGQDQAAIEELKLGLATDDDGSIHFQLGRLYQKSGQQNLAAAAFAETRRLQSKE
jgi:tetratricopeptide (TPR) repeat protein